MPFANLPSREKDAFFGLLDEYFQSRPGIFAAHGPQQAGAGAPARDGSPASAIKQAMASNPEATAKVFSAGLRHAANAASTPPPRSVAHNDENDNDNGPPTSVAGRIAALAAGRNNQAGSNQGSTYGISTLTSSRKFGDVDTSSAKGLISSLRQTNKGPPPPAAAPIPSVLPKTNNSFVPPPVHRGLGQPPPAAQHQHEEEDEAPPPAPAPPPPPPGRKFAQKEEERGEWAEALYDYESSEQGDLNIKEGQRVLVTERSSDDWWTGELNGQSGLFPAAYVKLL